MKSIYRFIIVFLLLITILIFLFTKNQLSNSVNKLINEKLIISTTTTIKIPLKQLEKDKTVTICVVVCGERKDEALTMLKSALIFTHVPLEFIVITEDDLIIDFDEKLTDWKYKTNKTFTYTIKPIKFPDQSDVIMWKKLFKPCAAQRLFLPVNIQSNNH